MFLVAYGTSVKKEKLHRIIELFRQEKIFSFLKSI